MAQSPEYWNIEPRDIISAYRHLSGIFDASPAFHYTTVMPSGRKVRILVKCEHVNSMKTFKIRGAEIKVSKIASSFLGQYEKSRQLALEGEVPNPSHVYSLSELELVTASAGNHAQGVALAASRWGIPAKIFIPVGTPAPKLERLLRVANAASAMQINIVNSGNAFDETLSHCLQYSESPSDSSARKKIFVSPYDDSAVIAGQGTVLAEYLLSCVPGMFSRNLLRMLNPANAEYLEEHMLIPDVVIAGLGGGGLTCGMGAFAQHINYLLGSHLRVVGVQSEHVDSMFQSFHNGGLHPGSDSGKTIADGIAVKNASLRMYRTVQRYVDDIVRVSDEEIMRAIGEFHWHPLFHKKSCQIGEYMDPECPERRIPGNKNHFTLRRPLDVIEGAAGAALAGIAHLDYGKLGIDKENVTVLAILSGGNIGNELMQRIVSEYQPEVRAWH